MADTAYVPHPIDTSQISLAHLEPLLEQLAKNAHEMWSQKRLEDGWTYGPERNDKLKTHPSLVPYEELSESEKSYDRALVNEALKSILSLGYTIEKR
ncbi:MAG: RyR domain-containing protein [Candidatus Acidiferrales bacterium]